MFKETWRQRGLKRAIIYLIEARLIQGTIAILRFFPLWVASGFGSLLFRTFGPLLRADKVARKNLARAFPDWTQQQIDSVVREVWDNLGRGAGEFAHIDRVDPTDPNGPVEVVGLENLIAARDQGSFIIVSAHMANWEVAGLVAAYQGCPLSTIYRTADNPWMDKYLRHLRSGIAGELIPKGRAGTRVAISALKRGLPLGVLIDQKLNEGVPVPFFGRPAMTASAPVEMALRYDVPILPVRLERIEKTRFRVTILPPMERPNTGDQEQDALTVLTEFNRLLEGWIRERPGQWFWVHKRWPE